MSVFAAAVAAALQGDAVGLAWGASFAFASQAMAVWQGMGPLDASAFGAPTFQGLGPMGSVGAVELGQVEVTQGVTFELSGLDTTLFALSQNQAAEIRGRRAKLFLLTFDARSLTLLGANLVRTLEMNKMTVKADANADPPTMRISLSAEPILAAKDKAPFALLTDGDQRARYPGDRGLERTQVLTHRQTLTF